MTPLFFDCRRVKRPPVLKLHEDCTGHAVLAIPQIGSKAWDQRSWRALVSTRRRNTARTGEVRHIGGTMVVLQSPRNVLAWHVVEGSGRVPRLVLVSRIFREVWCARSCRRTVYRWQQNQIPSRVVDSAAADRKAEQVPVKPEPVVEHEPEEALFGPLRGIAVTAHAATVLAACIAR